MTDVGAELAAIQTQLDDLVERVAAAALRASADKEESVASDLFEAERALTGARRRVRAALRQSR